MGGHQASGNCRECLGALAHRLAQTATALRGGLELGLLTKRADTEYQAILEQSLELADRMVQLIVSLRDLAESNSPAGPPVEVSLTPLIQEIMEGMQGLAGARNLHLRLSAPNNVQVSASPGRLREALTAFVAWVIQNSLGGGAIKIEIASAGPEAQVSLTPPRLDLQYLRIKALEDICSPGVLFSHASQGEAMSWAINRGLVESLGGRLEMVGPEGGEGCVRARFPAVPISAAS